MDICLCEILKDTLDRLVIMMLNVREMKYVIERDRCHMENVNVLGFLGDGVMWK